MLGRMDLGKKKIAEANRMRVYSEPPTEIPTIELGMQTKFI
jgi:hypothetical protein